MTRSLTIAAFLMLIAGCAHSPGNHLEERLSREIHRDPAIAEFSTSTAGGLPDRWTPLVIHRTKKRTRYQLITEQGSTVLHAQAAGASSGLMQHVSIDPFAQPWINWRWRIGGSISTVKNFQHDAEDLPARIILGFDGDKDALPFADQVLFETARVITGHDFPYATLMYVWKNKAPIDTVIDSTRSGRIKMIVAASGSEGIGQWQDVTRNIAEDYERAFGEKPGRLIGVGVLTETDNIAETVEAWYGDIRLVNERKIASRGR